MRNLPLDSASSLSNLPSCWKPRHSPDADWLDHAIALRSTLGLQPLSALVLAGRTDNLESARAFLSPRLSSLHDPLHLRGMDQALDRIARAISRGESIAIFGDYDVDGLTATSLLFRFFRWLGIIAIPYIPHRLNEGYGMSIKGIESLHGDGVSLIITVDNGIGSHEEIAYAARLGMDVVVTDHHQPTDALPPAAAVINPNRRDCSYPFKWLSGVGIAFKLAHALARHLGKPAGESKAFLLEQMDLVALGTVADMVPLCGENRVFASYGLRALAQTQKSGLRQMIERLGLDGAPITPNMVGYRIGPRLNAAGRTEDAMASLRLLLCDDESESSGLLDELERMNTARRDAEAKAFGDAVQCLDGDPDSMDDPVLVVYGPDWHQGVLGIVASKLVDQYGKPAIVLANAANREDDGPPIIKGSARSIEGYDILAAIQKCRDFLLGFGGHPMAAGLILAPDQLPAFRYSICSAADSVQMGANASALLFIDAVATIGDLSLGAIQELNQMQPFGEGNPEPLIALRQCRLSEQPQIMKGRHLKIKFCQKNGSGNLGEMFGIAFGAGSRYEEVLRSANRFDLAGVPQINDWNGKRTVELTIRDIQPAS